MALWEYKVITSGKGGFASATMLESYLNQLGKDEWEIIDFRTDSANLLAFNGLARRPTQREWTLEAAVAAAAKAEADKLRAELMNKQHAGDAAAGADAPGGSTPGDKAAGPDGLRQLRDTDRDHDPEALADEASHGADDWSNLDNYEDDLPTFFDAIKPHLRKNPSTPGQSVALNYLAKRWEQPETDLHGALKECGFVIPENETDAPLFLEFEGDLYWVEKNNRGQFFLNSREKPRPKFRVAQGKPLDPSDPVYVALAEEQAAIEAERAKRAAEQAAREAEAQAKRAEREAQRLAAEQARREQQAAAQAAREAARAASQAAAAAAQAAKDAVTPTPAPGTDEAASLGEATPAPLETPAANESAAPVVPDLLSEPIQPTPPPVTKAPGQSSSGASLPVGGALLDAIRPQMRRNRRGPGYSGSSAYLAKFFKVEESVLKAALAELGLVPGGTAPGKEFTIIGAYAYWVNKDGNGVLWINGREASQRERAEARALSGGTTSASPQVASAPEPEDSSKAETSGPMTESPASETGEPPIFRAVPRAMPPIPVPPEPVVPVELAAPVEPIVVVEAPSPAPAPTEEPVVAAPVDATAPAEIVAPTASPEPEPPPTSEVQPVLELVAEESSAKPAKAAKSATGKKSRAKPADTTEPQGIATAETAAAGVETEAAKPVKVSPKPRTKRRSSSAIEADAAAEE